MAPPGRFAMLVAMKKPRDSSTRWREIVRGHASSGLSVAAYCRQTRVPQSSFYAWRRTLRNAEPPAQRRSRSAFAEVRLAPEPDSANDHGALELHLPRGRRVIVRPGFDRQTLLDLVVTLEAAPVPPIGTARADAAYTSSERRGAGA